MRAGVSIVCADAVAVGEGQRRAWARGARIGAGGPRETRERLYRQGRTRRLRGSLSARTLGRDETARRARAGVGGGAAIAADGRAVFGARCPHGDYAARGVARYLAVRRHAGP